MLIPGRPPWRCLLALAATSLWLGHADLPVHCLRHQVAGDWAFTLGPAGPHRSSCGHHRPDNQNTQPPLSYVASMGGATSVLRLALRDPSVASAEDGSSGTWTMIYDEGFEVSIGGQVFLAFSHFEYVQDAAKGKTNVSHCDATHVGWYHNAARTQWGCYVGRKSTAGVEANVEDVDSPGPSTLRVSLAASSSEQSVLAAGDADQGDVAAAAPGPAQPSLQADSSPADAGATLDEYKPWVPGSAGYDNPMPNQWQQSVAEALNFLQLGWKAAAHEIFEGKTPRELNRYAGVNHSRPAPQHRHRFRSPRSFSSFLGLGSRVKRASDGEALDWRERDGRNWLEPVVTQGDCGSCYTISTVRMLTARNRISHGDLTRAAFSVSFPLYCSEYNQGCDGGYGFLQSKWLEDVGLVPESCAPFSEGGGSCRALPDCDLGSTRYRAVNHHYVGGFYGASEEGSIRHELVTNGPVVMSFEPREDFMYYKSGVYRSGPNRIHQEWQQVDHAVLLIGYGEDNGQSYWTMQNSWGGDWGEGGYFRMARGIDESGCESIVVAAEVAEESSNDVLDEFLGSL